MSVNADLLESFKSEFLGKKKINADAGSDNTRIHAMDVTKTADVQQGHQQRKRIYLLFGLQLSWSGQ